MPPYRLIYPEIVREKLQALVDSLTSAPELEMLRRSLAGMEARLQDDPLVWGDPDYRLQEMKLNVHHALTESFVVYYGVNEERRHVYVKDFVFFS